MPVQDREPRWSWAARRSPTGRARQTSRGHVEALEVQKVYETLVVARQPNRHFKDDILELLRQGR